MDGRSRTPARAAKVLCNDGAGSARRSSRHAGIRARARYTSRALSDRSDTSITPEPRVSARSLSIAFAIAAVGALGALPGSRSGPDPIALLAWLSLWSLPAGFAYGAAGLPLWPLAPVVPALWMALVALVDGVSMRDLASPAWCALAFSGLFAAGVGVGRLAPRSLWLGVGALLLLCGFLAMLPAGAGVLDRPWPPRVSALLLDFSPTTLLVECAGVDWMRHPAMYDAAATADIDPSLRTAWRGILAGPASFLLGCCLAVAGDRIARTRR